MVDLSFDFLLLKDLILNFLDSILDTMFKVFVLINLILKICLKDLHLFLTSQKLILEILLLNSLGLSDSELFNLLMRFAHLIFELSLMLFDHFLFFKDLRVLVFNKDSFLSVLVIKLFNLFLKSWDSLCLLNQFKI